MAHFERPAGFRDYFEAYYGPVVAAYDRLAEDPDRTAALDRDLESLAQRFDRGRDRTVMDWEYLLVTCRRRAA